jgi:hypothetical protein
MDPKHLFMEQVLYQFTHDISRLKLVKKNDRFHFVFQRFYEVVLFSIWKQIEVFVLQIIVNGKFLTMRGSSKYI